MSTQRMHLEDNLYMMTRIDGISGYTPIQIIGGKMRQLDGMYHVANAIQARMNPSSDTYDEDVWADAIWDAIEGLCQQAIDHPTIEAWGDYSAQLMIDRGGNVFTGLSNEEARILDLL